MLLSFSIANFRSFREEQTLSMVASSDLMEHPTHLRPIPNSSEQLLHTAVVYGANGSGKSNLVKGLAFAQKLVLQGTAPDNNILREPFLFSKSTPSEPTTVEVRFVRDGNAFSYGFKITDVAVQEEWLLLLVEGREMVIYERLTNSEGNVQIEPGPALKDGHHDKVLALINIGVRANQLFLAGVRETLNRSSFGPLLLAAIDWFQSIHFITPETTFTDRVLIDSDYIRFAGNFLKDSSTGISNLRITTSEIVDSKLASELTQGGLSTAIKELNRIGRDAFVEIVDSKVVIKTLRSDHEIDHGSKVGIPFSQESDGTRRLVSLLPSLYHLHTEQRIFIIDEIDRSLHPLLSRKFIEYFLKAGVGSDNQIILTTHESNLMDPDLLRRDELWFTEKDSRGATSLYSLLDFKIRPDLKLDKGYLQGRFGAIPFLGNLDNLLVKQTGQDS